MPEVQSTKRPSPLPANDGIVVEGLTKRFRTLLALDNVNLEVFRGEVVALLGKNGAGKSTLLRVLGTTVLPDAGRATVAGHDVVRQGMAARRASGVVLGDERSWYWRLTGRANLEFFAALYGLKCGAARDRASALLGLVGLHEAADRRFDGYSSGMRARLSVARALLAHPPVLLLDEPSRTVDPMAAAEFRHLVLRLSHAQRRAVLWVTHDLHEAAEVADRVVVLSAGTVIAESAKPASAAELAKMLVSVLGESADFRSEQGPGLGDGQ